MPVNIEVYRQLMDELGPKGVQLVAVSKTKPVEDVQALYDLGHRDFGENYVQELAAKADLLPKDIRWHFIGHLQSNKVKYIAPFVHLIHGVDSFKLLKEINKQAAKNNRIINVLSQIHIAKEETKFGLDEAELQALFNDSELPTLTNISIQGLMGMASFTNDESLIRQEFQTLKTLFNQHAQPLTPNSQPITHLSTANCQLSTLSMGMSADYRLAIAEGSNLVRIGSALFGARSGPVA